MSSISRQVTSDGGRRNAYIPCRGQCRHSRVRIPPLRPVATLRPSFCSCHRKDRGREDAEALRRCRGARRYAAGLPKRCRGGTRGRRDDRTSVCPVYDNNQVCQNQSGMNATTNGSTKLIRSATSDASLVLLRLTMIPKDNNNNRHHGNKNSAHIQLLPIVKSIWQRSGNVHKVDKQGTHTEHQVNAKVHTVPSS